MITNKLEALNILQENNVHVSASWHFFTLDNRELNDEEAEAIEFLQVQHSYGIYLRHEDARRE